MGTEIFAHIFIGVKKYDDQQSIFRNKNIYTNKTQREKWSEIYIQERKVM